MSMTKAEMEALAQQIADVGQGVQLEDWLGALGIVVTNALIQLQPDERMAGAVGWIAALCREMTRQWSKSRTN